MSMQKALLLVQDVETRGKLTYLMLKGLKKLKKCPELRGYKQI